MTTRRRRKYILAITAAFVAVACLVEAFFAGVAAAPSVNPRIFHPPPPPHVTGQIHGRYNGVKHA